MAGCSNLNTIDGVWGHKPDLCKCETKETLSNYSLECQEFDTTRELMRKRFFETCGITYLDLNLFLDAKEDGEYKDWRSFMLSELENLWVGIRRFATRHPITHAKSQYSKMVTTHKQQIE